MKNIWLIRHGETPGNRKKRYIGITDEPLTEKGIAQARALNVGRVDAVYTSPLQRCVQTAQIAFPNVPYILCDGLIECNFGLFEGENADEMAAFAAYRKWVDGGCTGDIPGGESVKAFKERCCAAFTAEIRSSFAAKAAFVTHGGCIMAILERFEGNRAFYDYRIGNGEYVQCEMDDVGRLRITGGVLC